MTPFGFPGAQPSRAGGSTGADSRHGELQYTNCTVAHVNKCRNYGPTLSYREFCPRTSSTSPGGCELNLINTNTPNPCCSICLSRGVNGTAAQAPAVRAVINAAATGYAVAIAGARSGIARYPFIIVGLLLVLGGVAAVGVFLVAAGEGSIASAVILGLVAAGCLIGGISLASASARRRGGRGGLLSAESTRAEDASTDWNTPHGATGTTRDQALDSARGGISGRVEVDC
jgi:hypothetical protein